MAEDYKKIKHMMTPYLFGFATSSWPSCTSTSRTCCPRCSECLYPGQRTTIYTCMYTHSTCTLNIHENMYIIYKYIQICIIYVYIYKPYIEYISIFALK